MLNTTIQKNVSNSICSKLLSSKTEREKSLKKKCNTKTRPPVNSRPYLYSFLYIQTYKLLLYNPKQCVGMYVCTQEGKSNDKYHIGVVVFSDLSTTVQSGQSSNTRVLIILYRIACTIHGPLPTV